MTQATQISEPKLDDDELLADLAWLAEASQRPLPLEPVATDTDDEALVYFVPPLPVRPKRHVPWSRPAMALAVLLVGALSFSSYALGRLQTDQQGPTENALIVSLPHQSEGSRPYYPSLEPPAAAEEPPLSRAVTTPHLAATSPAPRSQLRTGRAGRGDSSERTATSTTRRSRADRAARSEDNHLSRLLDDVLGGSTGTGNGLTLPDAPTRAQVLSGLRAVSSRVSQCGTPSAGSRLTVDVTIHGPTGRISAVDLQGPHGPATAACVQRALSQATFPRFTDSSFEVERFPYVVR